MALAASLGSLQAMTKEASEASLGSIEDIPLVERHLLVEAVGESCLPCSSDSFDLLIGAFRRRN